jgi:hypothetical protein
MSTSTKSPARHAATAAMAHVSGPTVFGIHFAVPGSTSEFSLTCVRWTEGLTLGLRPAGQDWWTTVRVDAPERFTLGREINTARDWKSVVERWFAATNTHAAAL